MMRNHPNGPVLVASAWVLAASVAWAEVTADVRASEAWRLHGWRRVSALSNQDVPAYSSLNGRAAWRRGPIEIALVGRNLLQPRHAEFGGGAEVERSLYGELACRF